MDLYQIIEELLRERNRIQGIIESLERMNSDPKIVGSGMRKRRGRKSMDPAARQEVSARMKRYWAKRHAKGDGNSQISGATA
jgi:hypothetical protein